MAHKNRALSYMAANAVMVPVVWLYIGKSGPLSVKALKEVQLAKGPCLTPRTLVLRLDSETLMLDSEAHHAEEEMSRCQEDEHQTNLTFLTPVPVRATNYCMSMSISSQSRQVPQPWKCLFVKNILQMDISCYCYSMESS